MKPDKRLVTSLTNDILKTSEYWAIFGDDFMDIRQSKYLSIVDGFLEDYLEVYSKDRKCCPVAFDCNGMPYATPWPIAEGENEIVEWRGIPYNLSRVLEPPPKHEGWILQYGNQKILVSEPYQDTAYEPVPRQENKWVWEPKKT